MESNLVAEFMEQTGSDTETAYSFLQAKHWDLVDAIQAFHHFSNLPPVRDDLNTAMPEPSVESDKAVRGSLQKTDAIDLIEVKKLARGISRATDNVNLVSRARSEFALDFKDNPYYKINKYFIETPEYTFTLPDLTIYGDEFREFLEKDLIEKSTLVSLEQAGRLNWWADYGLCQRLWPLSTTGDGNCLLHAASLAMWGFHDRLLTLRHALHSFLLESTTACALYRRWRWQQARINAQAGFVYSEDEWRSEWNTIVSMASTEPRKVQNGRRISVSLNDHDSSIGATYESLEEIHVLALAHVLRRPIIIIADLMLKDMNGEAIAPIPFGGIYLPFEIPIFDCHKSPLLLTYDMAHFSALVVMERDSYGNKTPVPPALIPLTDSEGCLLPIQFSIDPGEHFSWGNDDTEQHIINRLILTEKVQILLLRDYLDVVEMASSPTEEEVLDSEDEIDKKFSEILDIPDDTSESNLFGTNKSRAAKQLQSVAKQFGSIGKSMSKKLKKNLGSITKITKPVQKKQSNSNIPFKAVKFICAQLHTKRHEYQEQMVQNYLQCAETRFLREAQQRNKSYDQSLNLREQAIIEGPLNCINTGCPNTGTAITSYMCETCFQTQREKEISQSINSPNMSNARYGAGKSKFYRECDTESQIKNFPNAKSLNDQTLYLSKSTFYNDTGKPFEYNNDDSKIKFPTCPPAYNTGDAYGESGSINGDDYDCNEYSDEATNFKNGVVWRKSRLLADDCYDNTETYDNVPNSYESNARPVRVLNRPYSSVDETSVSSDSDKMNKRIIAAQDYHRSSLPSKPFPTSTVFTKKSDFDHQKHPNVTLISISPVPSFDVTDSRLYQNNGTSYMTSQPCRSENCKFYGNADTDFYCSKCRKQQRYTGTLI